MPLDLTFLLVGIAIVVITIWWGSKALLARFQKRTAERQWFEATTRAIAATPDLLDTIGPLSEEELRELLKQIVFEITRAGAVSWADLVGTVGWVRKRVREQAENPEIEPAAEL
ncbi:hypothetical protein C3B61_14895 [Cryobacterium zongtaii]|uniref:Uncharacterized protein n=1 Tax=Cryobacterium zongtaii TaxID=1259217 RepID=A0A2S3ZBF0_9MICO|nr:hypothetical protein [Cryobacterium zongtaii]POH62966.1 hypothetical protein C3B61_14895 [Cryobacterium zongtaii]